MAKPIFTVINQTTDLRTVCMYCEKQRIKRGFWTAVSDGKSILEHPTSHGVCPTCYQDVLEELTHPDLTEDTQPSVA